jgi:hypothetical protein
MNRKALKLVALSTIILSLFFFIFQVANSSQINTVTRIFRGAVQIINGNLDLSPNFHITGDNVFSHANYYASDSVATTVATANVFQQIDNTFVLGSTMSDDFVLQTDSLIYSGSDSIEVLMVVQIGAASGTANRLAKWNIFKNFVSLGQKSLMTRHFTTANRIGAAGITTLINLMPNDTLQLRVSAGSNGIDIIHDHIQLSFVEVEREKIGG